MRRVEKARGPNIKSGLQAGWKVLNISRFLGEEASKDLDQAGLLGWEHGEQLARCCLATPLLSPLGPHVASRAARPGHNVPATQGQSSVSSPNSPPFQSLMHFTTAPQSQNWKPQKLFFFSLVKGPKFTLWAILIMCKKCATLYVTDIWTVIIWIIWRELDLCQIYLSNAPMQREKSCYLIVWPDAWNRVRNGFAAFPYLGGPEYVL